MKNKKLFAILTLVCFMFTLMPVAAFAANPAVADMSIFMAKEYSEPVAATEKVDFLWKIRDNQAQETDAKLDNVYVWAVDANGNRTSALNLFDKDGVAQKMNAVDNTYGPFDGVYNLNESKVSFARPGTYTVYAGTYNADKANQTIANAVKLIGGSQIVVYGASTNPEETYLAGLDVDATSPALKAEKVTINNITYDAITTNMNDGVIGTLNVTPNNVAEKVVVKFLKAQSIENQKFNDLAGKTVTIETGSSNITVNKETAVTSVLGQIEFNLSASREGVYDIYLEVDGVEFIIRVNCGNTQAAYIETVEEPDALVALYETSVDVEFEITDINGNVVKDAYAVGNGAEGLFDKGAKGVNVKYLYFTEKPVGASLTDAGLGLTPNATESEDGIYALTLGGTLDAEGKYAVRAILDNGAYADASWEVKRFQTPVELKIKTASTIELGTAITPSLYYVDVNGVQKEAKDAELSATGYAIYSFNGKTVTAKTDEKYAGSVVTLTAASERYDLVAVKEVKVAAEAVAIEFAEKALAVNVNNKVAWNVVDEEGNDVTLNDTYKLETVKYIVLDKPADAKVSIYDRTNVNAFDGDGEMALTSDTVGNVTVQVIAQVQVGNDTKDLAAKQTKYYTGTEVFAVGTESKGDVVVMSIGSTEIVINDEVSDMGVAPIIENGRTFVPYRAGLEALGATVAYDEATQAVSAEMNGVTVVMTIGSNVYTVNGVEKTMDVAPFISESRTMVPARFAAQAFGITVIPTQNPDGTTADVLYIL